MDWKLQQPGSDALGSFRRNLSKRLTLAAARATEKAARLARDDTRREMRAQRLGGLANTIASTSDRQKGRVNVADISVLDVAAFVELLSERGSPRVALASA